MSEIKSTITLTVDASGVETGVNSAKRTVEGLGQTATSVGTSMGGIGQSATAAGAKADKAAQATVRSQKAWLSQVENTVIAYKAAGDAATAYELRAQAKGVPESVYGPKIAQLRQLAAAEKAASAAAAAAADAAAAAAAKATPQLNAMGMSAKATANAMRQVPAQMTDIVVSLQGGQKPLSVLFQQGGQLKDMFGGAGNAARALGTYVLGLVNPFTIAAAAVGTLGLAYYQGQKEANAYSLAIIGSGNAAGTTVGQMQGMAAAISKATGATQAAAADAVAQFAAGSNASATQLQAFATVAIKVQRTLGTAVGDTVKQFAELGKDPVAASVRLNETTNYLTLSLYQQIKALEDQGRTTEAATLAQKAFADAMSNRADNFSANLGTLERAWLTIGDAAKNAWDKMLDVGRASTPESKIEELQARLKAGSQLPGQRTQQGAYLSKDGRIALEAELQTANRVVLRNFEAAASVRALNEQVKARIELDKIAKQFESPKQKREKELTVAREVSKNAGGSAEELALIEKGIREKYKDKVTPRGPKDNSAAQEAKAALALDLDAIKAAMVAETDAYANHGKVLDAMRAGGLVSEGDYYAAKAALLELDGEAQDAAFQAEINRLNAERETGLLSGKDAITNMKAVQDAESKRARAAADNASALEVLGIQENTRIGNTARAFEEARQSAQDYFDTTKRGYARELAGFSLSDSERKRLAGRTQIEDKYSNQRNDIENKFLLSKDQSPEAKKLYDEKLALIKEFEEKALAEWDAYYTELKLKESNWVNGAERAIQAYLADVNNVAKLSEGLFTNAFKGMEDALFEFTKTGKLSFTDMANSIVDDITRIIIKQQIMAPLMAAMGLDGKSGGGSILGSLIGGTEGGAGGGGFLDGLGKYLVDLPSFAVGTDYVPHDMVAQIHKGERIVTAADNALGGGSAGNTVHINVNQTFAPNTSRATVLQAAADASRQLSMAGRNL